MSVTYTKLMSSITESTVWMEPNPTRIAWIAMLAMADRKGRVWGSIPGLANRARISVDEARTAIDTFLSPDPDSRTKDYEGRRIAEIDGGWVLLNYEKHRNARDADERRNYMRQYMREKRKAVNKAVNNVSQSKPALSQAEAEAEADNGFTNVNLSGSASEPRRIAAGLARKEQQEAASRLLEFLNEKTGRNYRPVAVNLDKISARLREGYTELQCRQVVVKKCREWMPDEKMAVYLRPATLFGREKFNQYVGELGQREVSHDFG